MTREQEEFLADQEQALAQAEPQSFSEKLAHGAPWWLISMFAHGVAAIICVFIVAVSVKAKDQDVVIVSTPVPVEEKPPVVPDRQIKTAPLDLPKNSDQPFIAKAEMDNSNESPTDEPFKQLKGENPNALSDKPFHGKATYDIVGAGGGGGGKRGGPLGGYRLKAAIGGGGDPRTEDAVIKALLWLARHQNPDGSWSATQHVGLCGRGNYKGVCAPNPGAEGFNTGLTGLSLLAFLGAGYTHLSRDVIEGYNFGTVVKQGLQSLMNGQDSSGRLCSEDTPKYMYNHLIAAFALSEAYSLTSSMLVRDAAQKALDYAVQAQNLGKGWRYSFRSGDCDSSVTAWAAQLLKSAELAELTVNKDAYKGIFAWYDEVTEASYGRTGYTDARLGKVVIPGVNEQYGDHPSLSAISAMTRTFLGKRGDPRVRGGLELCKGDLPEWDARNLKVDFYYWYYASYMMFLVEGPTTGAWKQWNEKIKTAILDHQNVSKGDCRCGSWDPVDRWSSEGGRVYTTAMGALVMEVYYRSAHALNAYLKR
jgi:hypothetical protein